MAGCLALQGSPVALCVSRVCDASPQFVETQNVCNASFTRTELEILIV